MPEVSCSKREQSMFFNHLAHILRGVTVSPSIPTAVGVNDLHPISGFERNHGMDAVRLLIDSRCWPPENIVTQAKLEMSGLVRAAGNILLQINNLGKQCETQCVCFTPVCF